MYQVLLVDDEPIILSGIKFMIDWSKHNCQIAGTARNGQQALEKICAMRPDIVICDIAMPVLSGTQLLEAASEKSPDTVFIMLTNHPDFNLARHSLRFHAVDYLLKSQLVPEALEASLERACAEREKRTRLSRAALVDSCREETDKMTLQSVVLRLIQAPQGAPMQETSAALQKYGVLDGWAMAYLPVDYTQAGLEDADAADDGRLYGWVSDVVERLSENLFSKYLLLSPDDHKQSMFLLCWNLTEEEWKNGIQQFSSKVAAASAAVTKAVPRVLATDFFCGEEHLEQCRRELFQLRDYYYLTGESGVVYQNINCPELTPLRMTGFSGRLASELRSKNAAGVRMLLERVIARIEETPHERSHALWLCGEICDTIHGAFTGDEESLATMMDRRLVERLTTRTQVVRWLTMLTNELSTQLERYSSNKLALIEKAKQYVLDNVDKRIMLQDVADYVCISPGYLSALFKKLYNQNFVDYINQVKTERACELLREGRYRIYEISYMLSYENAYYFSRVFKRHTGMTPTEYQKKLRLDSSDT